MKLIHTKNIHRRLDEGKDEGEQKDNAEEEAAEEDEAAMRKRLV